MKKTTEIVPLGSLNMTKFHHAKPSFGTGALLFWVAASLTGCSKAEVGVELRPVSAPPTGWKSVCLDRFVFDFPPEIEMGSTEVFYRGAAGFSGIDDIGGGGVRWDGVKIYESIPTNEAGYTQAFHGAANTVGSANDFAAVIREQEGKIARRTLATKSGTAEERAAAKERVTNGKKDLAQSHYDLKVSGRAILKQPQAFAFRSGPRYSLGYLDPADRRVRLFEGAITHTEIVSPEAAGAEFERFQKLYARRLPTDIPSKPGYCTAFGFLDESDGRKADSVITMPFRSLKYPNLIFLLSVESADKEPKNIQELPNMDAYGAKLHMVGVKGSYGPVAETIAGSPGRSYGQGYGPNCSETSCRPADQAYEIEAETYGKAGSDHPRIVLRMIAATSDDYRLKLPAVPGDPRYNKPARPALSGKVPPTFKEGQQIFEQVLRSLRARPTTPAGPIAKGIAQKSPSK